METNTTTRAPESLPLTADLADAPDLSSYDLIVVNTSGGKDSQTTLRVVVQAAEAAGVRDRLIAVHADLPRAEWDGAKETAEAQAACYGVPFVTIRRVKGDLLDQVLERFEKRPDAPSWPSSTARFCTSDHKRDPIAKVIRRAATSGRVLNCLGLRAEESPARAKKSPPSR